jgi:hypothetical protein
MIIKQLLLIISLFIFTTSLFAQVEEPVAPIQDEQKEKARFIDRLVFGGDIGLNFGTITYIKLAPDVSYHLTSRWTAGLGPIYIYENYKNVNFKTSTYGGKAVTSFTLIKGRENGGSLGIGNIVLHGENEVINVEQIFIDINTLTYYIGDRIWIDNLLLGPGLVQTISGRFSVSMFILWDVTQNDFSPYSNPTLKFGFNF